MGHPDDATAAGTPDALAPSRRVEKPGREAVRGRTGAGLKEHRGALSRTTLVRRLCTCGAKTATILYRAPPDA
jgi:hypothetical protein